MSDEAVAVLIRTHVQRYVAIDIMDVYKLLHQAVFGSGHAITNQRAAREWLDNECAKLIPNEEEPILENVHPNGQIVRLHLRPYLALHGSLKKLLDAFVQSAKAVTGSEEVIAGYWQLFQQMCEPGSPLANRFSARTISLVGRTRAAEHWPASHHSPPYDRTHKPAYRVLTLSLAEQLLQGQRIPFVVF